MNLLPHELSALEETKNQNKVAYYHDMGLGKTFTGAEKLIRLNKQTNLVVCQKSKIEDWIDHLKNYDCEVFDLTNSKEYHSFILGCFVAPVVIGVINYDLVWRRGELLKLKDFTLLLDESSVIQHETSKRTKFILKLQPTNIVLLSGTPVGGKYENLWSQLHLLGWNISKKMFMNQYVDYHYEDNEGFPILIIDGYKHEDRLKAKMRQHGCHFLKTEDVLLLPEQNQIKIKVNAPKEYRVFHRDSAVEMPDGSLIVGDTVLIKMLRERQLCGMYCKEKMEALKDLFESTNDRLIVFYNFDEELKSMCILAEEMGKSISIINGKIKDLRAYEDEVNSITFVQYQAGAMGLNLQKANKVIFYTPTLSSELYEQAKKRIHRIGQTKPCFYYKLICKNSLEEKIYRTLELRKNYTDALFEEDCKNG